jgi:hypothetical protein
MASLPKLTAALLLLVVVVVVGWLPAVLTVPASPDFHAVECAMNQLAFELASSRVSSNLAAIHDALRLWNCSAHLDEATRAWNRDKLQQVLPQTQPKPKFLNPAALVLYVAPDGSDSNSGLAPASPLATLTRARDLLRTMRSSPPQQPAVIFLRGGASRLCMC